ncbi:MAG: hypothetical protein LBI78_02445 [Campylobacteraceae bacterium]|jgi:hypothetical protein|nr:hypothetical protein [Campylobacteraceae bacterium]
MQTSQINKTKYSVFKFFSWFISLFIIFTLIGCGGGSSGGENAHNATLNAQIPTIAIQPINAAYAVGEQANALSVTAEVADGGMLSYQWYKSSVGTVEDGIEISGETSNAYTPSTSVSGTFFYYVVVTNTQVNGNKTASIISNIVKVDVGYVIHFYDNDLNLNQSIVVSLGNVDLLQLIADYGLPTSLFETNSSTDISSYTDYNITSDINLYATKNVQEIRNEVELNNVRNNLSGKYILLSDITLTNTTLDETEGWLPTGDYYDDDDFSYTFTGILNGNNHTISGLWIDRPLTSYIGLFGAIYNAQVKNLEVEINNSNGGVRGYNFVGGIAGGVLGSNISNSYSTGDIGGDSGIGGIAGYIGGSNVSNSYSTGNISGNYGVGGIAGYISESDIASSYSKGDINGDDYVGGIAGGIDYSNVSNSYSTGYISGNSGVGGIVGYISESNVSNSYSAGNISGNYSIGGIVGVAMNDGVVVQNNAAINPLIDGASDANRIFGYNYSSTASNNFALETMLVNGNTVSGGDNLNGEGKSEADLKTKSTYESLGWSFGDNNANPWKIDENSSYPYLYWQR